MPRECCLSKAPPSPAGRALASRISAGAHDALQPRMCGRAGADCAPPPAQFPAHTRGTAGPFLQMRKQRPRELKNLSLSHTAH